MAHILVVDDDGDLCALLKAALERDGHQVSACRDGQRVDGAACRWADCILLDVMMPDEDGFALCRRIRDLADCPILFLTARTQEADVLTGLGVGGDDYLAKPFRIAELRARVAAHLRRQQRSLELAALTHDLKTPLSIVSGNAELLTEDALTAAQRQNVEAILRGSLRLEDYVAQLRTMTASGPEGGGRKETVELRLLAEGWQSAGQGLCAAKQIAFHCVGAPAGSVTVHRVSLDRAVGNLLDNAVRYTPRGGEISLTLHAAGGRLSIAVEDSGPGFSAGALAKGDQPFFTSDASRPQSGHLGLGLHFAARVPRNCGGELRLSNTGRGGRAELLLPLG